jgi:hypothetical protein
MTDYKILEARNAKDLEGEVMRYLEKGYQLAGGHQVTVIENDTRTNSTGTYYHNPSRWNITQAVYKLPQEKEQKRKMI